MDDVRAPQSPLERIAGAPISWGGCADVHTGAEQLRPLVAGRVLVP
jgi:hypothetical protein